MIEVIAFSWVASAFGFAAGWAARERSRNAAGPELVVATRPRRSRTRRRGKARNRSVATLAWVPLSCRRIGGRRRGVATRARNNYPSR
ncbi:MAG TPA: hypothetical protein VER17_13575 [Tepidisphaeraceae bacterium]|nr:hypothetical protein [Tepidisphaeraceae bacterium]